MSWDCIFAVSIVVGIIGSIIGTRISMHIAQSLDILDMPGELKIHEKPIPCFGGLGIVVGTFLAFIVTSVSKGSGVQESLGVVLGALIMALTGAIDDVVNLSPLRKLVGQLLSGSVLALFYWERFVTGSLPWVMRAFFPILVIAVIVFMSNAFNLLDGVDGMAAGTSVITCGCLLALAHIHGRTSVGILLGAQTGSCLGFMVYNTPPARTFMGDVGSLFLGYTVGVAVLDMAYFKPLSVPGILGLLLVLAIPVTDTVFAIARRILSNERVFLGDRYHFYDCILKALHGNTWRTLGVMWVITLVLGILGILVYDLDNTWVAIITAATGMLILILLALRIGCLPVCSTREGSKDHSSRL